MMFLFTDVFRRARAQGTVHCIARTPVDSVKCRSAFVASIGGQGRDQSTAKTIHYCKPEARERARVHTTFGSSVFPLPAHSHSWWQAGSPSCGAPHHCTVILRSLSLVYPSRSTRYHLVVRSYLSVLSTLFIYHQRLNPNLPSAFLISQIPVPITIAYQRIGKS